MKHDCSNCFYGGPGDPFECWDCWNYSHWIDICAYSKNEKGMDDNEVARKTEQDGDD